MQGIGPTWGRNERITCPLGIPVGVTVVKDNLLSDCAVLDVIHEDGPSGARGRHRHGRRVENRLAAGRWDGCNAARNGPPLVRAA